jgi:hypothetical protein
MSVREIVDDLDKLLAVLPRESEPFLSNGKTCRSCLKSFWIWGASPRRGFPTSSFI